jgi:Ca2+-binding RTX toxin-like protein
MYSGKGFKYDNNADHTPNAGIISNIKVTIGAVTMTFAELNANVATIRPLYESLTSNDLHKVVTALLASDDLIKGSQVADFIKGYGGNDIIAGNGGHDDLYGGTGADSLNGGAGVDTLTGGNGKDHFVFRNALGSENQDTITDFNVVQDTIDLAANVFAGAGTAGHVLAGDAFKVLVPGAMLDSTDRIIYLKASGDLYFDPDGNGAHGAVRFAHLDNIPNLTHSDFMIV